MGESLSACVKATGEVCIIKETVKERVSIEALQRLQVTRIPNLATPRRIWESDRFFYEELPYVGGVSLSEAIISGAGGLTGTVLESFHSPLMTTLAAMHKAGVIHRDVHPDNYCALLPANCWTAALRLPQLCS